jgi:hypothetical protein
VWKSGNEPAVRGRRKFRAVVGRVANVPQAESRSSGAVFFMRDAIGQKRTNPVLKWSKVSPWSALVEEGTARLTFFQGIALAGCIFILFGLLQFTLNLMVYFSSSLLRGLHAWNIVAADAPAHFAPAVVVRGPGLGR